MKYILMIPAIIFCLVTGCTDKPSEVVSQTDSTDSSVVAPEEDRNMFGLYLTRGLSKTSDNLADGYVMFTPTNSAEMYLINRKGEVVHTWKGNYSIMGGYLMDDGSLVQNAHDPDFPVFAGGGETGRIQKISWDGKILWDFEYATEEYHAHHDFAVMPNGNILAIAWEARTAEEALALGRKPEFIPKEGLWPDKIVEIKPTDKYHGEIVWEWHSWDHIIQNVDPALPNYGNPSEHPELLDINASAMKPRIMSEDSVELMHKAGQLWRNQTAGNMGSDVYHFNAINYNAELDQIAVSSPMLSEILIIDHSTTTEEAKGHSGGRYNKGGDFLYRWGNPGNYQQGDSTDRKLYHQHDVRWVEKGMPGEGNITIYNNEVPGGPNGQDYSSVYEIKLPMDNNGNYILNENNRFGPENPDWTYVADDTLSFYGSFISGAHRMTNGNTFINEGPRGRFFEVTSDGEIVWEYLNPYRGKITKPNGDSFSPIPMAYIGFRATFIPSSHPALKGRELVPLNPQPEIFKLPPPEKKETADSTTVAMK
jgi:hypothetical protein